MLFLISRKDHEYGHLVKNIAFKPTKLDPNVEKLLRNSIIPTLEQVGISTFNLAQYVTERIRTHNKVVDEEREALDKYRALSEEERKNYKGNIPSEPQDKIIGVLIADDVPNYLISTLVSDLRLQGISIYFDLYIKEQIVIDRKETDVKGISENITGDGEASKFEVLPLFINKT